MALDLSKRTPAQTALDLFHICLTKRVGEIERKELCTACYHKDPSQHRHECMENSDKDLFFGDKSRAYVTMEQIDKQQLFRDYFDLTYLYSDEAIKREASRLIASAPILTIQTLDEARLSVRKFYENKIADLYGSLKENFSCVSLVVCNPKSLKIGRKRSKPLPPLSPLKMTEVCEAKPIDLSKKRNPFESMKFEVAEQLLEKACRGDQSFTIPKADEKKFPAWAQKSNFGLLKQCLEKQLKSEPPFYPVIQKPVLSEMFGTLKTESDIRATINSRTRDSGTW